MEKERKPSQFEVRRKPRMYFGKPGQEIYNFVFYPRRKKQPRMYFGKPRIAWEAPRQKPRIYWETEKKAA
jgi:hypothetical protein